MIGDIAIVTLVFIGGYYAGKKFDTLGAMYEAAKKKVRGWIETAK